MDAVGAVDVGVARRAEHHGVARGRPAEAVRGRIGVVIGLDLDDPAADAVDQQRRADQVGRDLVDAAGKERATEVWLEALRCCSAVTACGAAATSMEHLNYTADIQLIRAAIWPYPSPRSKAVPSRCDISGFFNRIG